MKGRNGIHDGGGRVRPVTFSIPGTSFGSEHEQMANFAPAISPSTPPSTGLAARIADLRRRGVVGTKDASMELRWG
jgi:hypothetical protein